MPKDPWYPPLGGKFTLGVPTYYGLEFTVNWVEVENFDFMMPTQEVHCISFDPEKATRSTYEISFSLPYLRDLREEGKYKELLP